MISKFVNAGTADGYNPYRISREGVEWKPPEPGNPSAIIGYWSNHQIIYLEKLLEISSRFHPGKLSEMLTKRVFCYVSMCPTVCGSINALLKDPFKTIDFDLDAQKQIEENSALIR